MTAAEHDSAVDLAQIRGLIESCANAIRSKNADALQATMSGFVRWSAT